MEHLRGVNGNNAEANGDGHRDGKTAAGLCNHSMEEQLRCPPKLNILLNIPPATRGTQFMYGWSRTDKSPNIFIKPKDPLTFHRLPNSVTTDCIMGKVGFKNGIHCWQIYWPIHLRGSNAIIGVTTKPAPLLDVGYKSLVGNTPESWGWDIGRNLFYHDSKSVNYPKVIRPNEFFQVHERFLVILDMDGGTLSFMAKGHYLGVACRNLEGRELYPIVNAVWDGCEVTMSYIGGIEYTPLSLKSLSRCVVCNCLGKEELEEKVKCLCIPYTLKNYLLFKNGKR